MTNLQSTVTRSFVFTELFGAFYQTAILNSYFKILVESHYEGNDDQFSNTVKRRGIMVFRKYSAADYQCDILELLLWNPRQTPLWPKIWPISKTLSPAFYSPFSAGLFVRITESNILESLLWNFYLTKLRLIRWPVWKIFSQASESSFFATPIVLTIRTTLWSSYREIVS